MKIPYQLFTLITCVFVLAGCQNATPTPTLNSLQLSALPAIGDATRGQAFFEAGALGSDAVACSACHSIQAVKLSGPNLNGIALTASTRVAGQDAETYLFNAIVNPNVYIVEGFAKGVMPADYDKKYTPQQLRDLLAYLLTLR